jgi:vancomycin aglycone glucosyltransferase
VRAVLATAGGRGDVEPMQALGVRLVQAGHDVLLTASPDFEESSRELGVPFRGIGSNAQAAISEHVAALGGRPVALLRVMRELFEEEIGRHFDALMDAGRGADVIVCAALETAAASVAEALGVPYRYVLYAPVALRSRRHAPWILPWQHLPGWANRLLWAATAAAHDRLFLPRVNLLRRRLRLAPVRHALRYVFGSRPFLAADESLAPVPPDARRDVVRTGAWRLPARGELPDEVGEFIDAGGPPVYVGFGSMVQHDPGRTVALVAEAARLAGRRIVMSAGWSDLDECTLPNGCLGVRSAPHALLFTKMAAAVHHGGAGTTAAAARAGVPQVIVPHMFDQFYWGERVRELGLGPAPVPARRLTAGRLAEAIRVAVSDEEMRERAREAAEALSRVDGAARAARVLEREYG